MATAVEGSARWVVSSSQYLTGGLEQALDLAASMEPRGYGRAVGADPRRQRRASAVTVLGLVGVLARLSGLLDGSTTPLLGLPLVLAGAAIAALALAYGPGPGRDRRAHYRRDPRAAPEWLVTALGVAAAGVLVAAQQSGTDGLVPPQTDRGSGRTDGRSRGDPFPRPGRRVHPEVRNLGRMPEGAPPGSAGPESGSAR